MFKKNLLFLFAILLFIFNSQAQVTTSSMSGIIKNDKGESLSGATVTVIHQPTGTLYKTQTKSGGRFSITNMAAGGPYSVEITYVNYTTEKKNDVYLDLGQNFVLDFELTTKAQELSNVTVTTTKKSAELSGKGGTEFIIGRDRIDNLPTVGRNLNDLLRAVPGARPIGANGDGLSIAGQNNRFNSFYIDGALNNDVFGLSASGTNGGQTGTPPLSIDAIDQFQVVISPYDASQGNFTGGGINAISRSGTNRIQGSVYYLMRNQDLAGKTPNGSKTVATKFAEFTNKTYGFRVGGPILKNKLFYFINAESQRDVRPQPFDVDNNYLGTTKTSAQLQRLYDTLRARGGYDPGSYLDNPETINADRISVKVDWNINEKHKLNISHRYTKAVRNNTNASNSTAINFFNNGFKFPNLTNSTSLELKSKFGKNLSNKLLLTYSDVSDDRGPIGNPYPRIVINDGTGTGTTQGLVIGPDVSSQINILLQKNFSLINTLRWTWGKHSMSFGYEFEHNNVYNAFIQRSWGEYIYDNIDQFYNNQRPRQYRTAYSLVDKSDDNTNASAKFKVGRNGGFINDEIRVTDNFTLNMGIRADYYAWLTKPAEDTYSNTVAIPSFAQRYDMKGALSGQKPRIPLSVSPRFGFTYKVPDENLVFRGGAGLYTSRIPLVWPGGVYNNNGLFIGGFTVSATSFPTAWNLIRFRSDVDAQWRASELGIGLTKGGLNLISKEFKNPRVFRSSLAIDKKLSNGWTSTLEVLYSKNINEVFYTNLSAQAPAGSTTGPGSRLVFPAAAAQIVGATSPYDNAILLSNNKGDKGFSYNLNIGIERKSKTGLNFSFNYQFGNSVVVNEATSSVNLSQWQFMETVNGRNNITRSISDFDLKHRLFSYLSKRFSYAKGKSATTISIVYTWQSGQPFSYVYSGALTRDDASVGGTGGNDLIYVPTVSELSLSAFTNNTLNGVNYTPSDQRQLFNQFINNDRYLNKTRGKFAERNGGRLPFTHIIDVKIAQDFNVKLAKHTYQLQLTWDIFNFTNLLNRDWGRTFFLSNDQFALVNFRGFTAPGITDPVANQIFTTYGQTSATVGNVAATSPVYTFNPTFISRTPWNISTSALPNLAARWISQVGVRLNF